MSGIVHVVPKHNHKRHTNGGGQAECWCGAKGWLLCPECGGTDEGCWRCEASGQPGLVPAEYGDIPAIVIHNDEDQNASPWLVWADKQ